MVDLETTGTSPETTAIIQIAAVRFDMESGEISPVMFDRCLMMPHGRFFDESTREWWLKDKSHILRSIFERSEKPEVVMQAFVEWARAGIDPANDSLRLWAKPSHFEYPFIESYCRQFALPNPFYYRDVNDMNSFLRGRYFPHDPPPFERLIPFEGDAHSALFDVVHQIKVLLAAKAHSTPHPDPDA
jgi:hypothetical protein